MIQQWHHPLMCVVGSSRLQHYSSAAVDDNDDDHSGSVAVEKMHVVEPMAVPQIHFLQVLHCRSCACLLFSPLLQPAAPTMPWEQERVTGRAMRAKIRELSALRGGPDPRAYQRQPRGSSGTTSSATRRAGVASSAIGRSRRSPSAGSRLRSGGFADRSSTSRR